MQYGILVEVENLLIDHSDHGTFVSWSERSEELEIRKISVEMQTGDVNIDGNGRLAESVRDFYHSTAVAILEDLIDDLPKSV